MKILCPSGNTNGDPDACVDFSFWADDYSIPKGTATNLRWSLPENYGGYWMNCQAAGDWSGEKKGVCPETPVEVPGADISALPLRVSKGSNSTITWSSQDVSSCIVAGPDLASTDESGVSSVKINARSVFTITCKTRDADVTDSVLVNINPVFQEF